MSFESNVSKLLQLTYSPKLVNQYVITKTAIEHTDIGNALEGYSSTGIAMNGFLQYYSDNRIWCISPTITSVDDDGHFYTRTIIVLDRATNSFVNAFTCTMTRGTRIAHISDTDLWLYDASNTFGDADYIAYCHVKDSGAHYFHHVSLSSIKFKGEGRTSRYITIICKVESGQLVVYIPTVSNTYVNRVDNVTFYDVTHYMTTCRVSGGGISSPSYSTDVKLGTHTYKPNVGQLVQVADVGMGYYAIALDSWQNSGFEFSIRALKSLSTVEAISLSRNDLERASFGTFPDGSSQFHLERRTAGEDALYGARIIAYTYRGLAKELNEYTVVTIDYMGNVNYRSYGSHNEESNQMYPRAVDPFGNIITTTPNLKEYGKPGVIRKLNTSGNVVWSSPDTLDIQSRGTGSYPIMFDSGGNIYFIPFAFSTMFPPTFTPLGVINGETGETLQLTTPHSQDLADFDEYRHTVIAAYFVIDSDGSLILRFLAIPFIRNGLTTTIIRKFSVFELATPGLFHLKGIPFPLNIYKMV